MTNKLNLRYGLFWSRYSFLRMLTHLIPTLLWIALGVTVLMLADRVAEEVAFHQQHQKTVERVSLLESFVVACMNGETVAFDNDVHLCNVAHSGGRGK